MASVEEFYEGKSSSSFLAQWSRTGEGTRADDGCLAACTAQPSCILRKSMGLSSLTASNGFVHYIGTRMTGPRG